MAENERYKAAWKARRRRFWTYYAVLIALIGGELFVALSPQVRWPVPPVALLCFGIVGMISATGWLYQFRCPRCGEIFFSRWANGRLTFWGDALTCEHCGLQVNEIPGETS